MLCNKNNVIALIIKNNLKQCTRLFSKCIVQWEQGLNDQNTEATAWLGGLGYVPHLDL